MRNRIDKYFFFKESSLNVIFQLLQFNIIFNWSKNMKATFKSVKCSQSQITFSGKSMNGSLKMIELFGFFEML